MVRNIKTVHVCVPNYFLYPSVLKNIRICSSRGVLTRVRIAQKKLPVGDLSGSFSDSSEKCLLAVGVLCMKGWLGLIWNDQYHDVVELV